LSFPGFLKRRNILPASVVPISITTVLPPGCSFAVYPANATKRRSWRTQLDCLDRHIADRPDLELHRLTVRHATTLGVSQFTVQSRQQRTPRTTSTNSSLLWCRRSAYFPRCRRQIRRGLQPVHPGIRRRPALYVYANGRRAATASLGQQRHRHGTTTSIGTFIQRQRDRFLHSPVTMTQAISISVAPPSHRDQRFSQRTGRHSLQRFGHHQRRVRHHRVRT